MLKTGRIILLTILALCFYGITQAADSTFTAGVDKNTVALDDTIQFTLKVAGQSGSVPKPELPKFTNLRVVSQGQSSNFSFVNGQMSSSVSFAYTLQPEKTGPAHIGAASLTIGGKTYTTEPVSITVTKAEGKKAQPQSKQGMRSMFPGFPDDDDFFNSRLPRQSQPIKDPVKTELKASQTTIYVNQQIMLTFTFYRKANVYRVQYGPPDTKGFWDIKLPEDKKDRDVSLNGVRYLAHDLKTILFPTTAGDFTIGSATLNVQTDPFSAAQAMKTDSIKIRVLPLPKEGKPESFSGAVGDYQMDVSLKQNKIERGQPVQLTAKIWGRGNIQTISEPVIDLPKEFKKLSATGKEDTVKDASGLSGSKSFDIVLIPLKEGAFVLPPFEFSFFDPVKKQYRVLKSKELSLTISPSSTPLPQEYEKSLTGEPAKKPVGINIPWDKIGAAALKTITSLFFWIPVLAIILVIIIVSLFRKYRARFAADPAKARQKQALKVARNRLKKAARLLKKNDLKEFLTEIFNATAKYLGDKYGFSAAGITTDGLREILSSKGLAEQAQKQLENFITECDMLRFTPSQFSREKAVELSQVAENLIITIEKLG
jgi:hypothetical protein